MILHTSPSAQEYRATAAGEFVKQTRHAITQTCTEVFGGKLPETEGEQRAALATVGVEVTERLFKIIEADYVLIKRADLEAFGTRGGGMDTLLAAEEAAGRYDPKNAMHASPYQTLDLSPVIVEQLFNEVNT